MARFMVLVSASWCWNASARLGTVSPIAGSVARYSSPPIQEFGW